MKRRCLALLSLLSLIFTGIIPTDTFGYSAEVSYFFEGIDLDLGCVEIDPTVLVLTMGETIEEMLAPTLPHLNDFSPTIDVSVTWQPATLENLTLVFQHIMPIAVVEQIAFEAIDLTSLDTLVFADSSQCSISLETMLVAWTGEQYVKLRFFERSDRVLGIESVTITAASTVPEPSTWLLIGGGLFGVGAYIRRRHARSIVLLGVAWWTLSGTSAFAQEGAVVTILKSGSGDGTIAYGDARCEPGCRQFTIPYVEHAGAVLKAIPADQSRFLYWMTPERTLLQGEWRVQPGETVVAVFQNSLEVFADDLHLTAPPDISDYYGAMRGRYVRVFPEALLKEEHAILNLFDDIPLKVTRKKIIEENDAYYWFGLVDGAFWSDISIVITKETIPFVSGTISFDDKLFSIENPERNIYLVVESDYTVFDEGATTITPHHNLANSQQQEGVFKKLGRWGWHQFSAIFMPSVAYAQESATIDVMVMYTPATEKKLGNNPHKTIELIIKKTNEIYAQSGIYQRLQLVHTEKIAYQESGILDDDLAWLREQGNQQGSDVYRLREQYAADVIGLWVSDKGRCRQCDCGGIAKTMESVSGFFAADAFSVTKVSYALNNYSFAHELGHTMGANHDWADNQSEKPYPYSHGYVFLANNLCWFTVMATPVRCDGLGYNEKERRRLDIFSNPDRLHEETNQPLGVPEGEEYAADNRKTLNNTATTVAAFRPLTQGMLPFNFSLTPGDVAGTFEATVAIWEGGDHREMVINSPLALHFAVPSSTLFTADDLSLGGQPLSASRTAASTTPPLAAAVFSNYSGQRVVARTLSGDSAARRAASATLSALRDAPQRSSTLSAYDFLFRRTAEGIAWNSPYFGRFFYDPLKNASRWNPLSMRVIGRYDHQWQYNPFAYISYAQAAEANGIDWTPEFALTLSSDWWWATSVGRVEGNNLVFAVGEWDDYDGIKQQVTLTIFFDDLRKWRVAAYRPEFEFRGTQQPIATTEEIFGGGAVHYQDMYPIVLLFARNTTFPIEE